MHGKRSSQNAAPLRGRLIFATFPTVEKKFDPTLAAYETALKLNPEFTEAADALALGKIFGALLYRTSAFDAGVLGSVAGMLAAIALIICWLPAHRAARVDPLVALRTE
jgi:ABC-type lipoprotein release transport system permease subunit